MQERRRKILFLTGTRADFGKLKTLMLKIESAPDFDCYIFVTGMHMLSNYGSTVEEIRKCGFKNIFPFINQMAHDNSGMDLVLSNTILGLGHYVRELQPDLIVIHGDRVEALAGATVGALNNILVAHIEGGELSGTVDELIRHAISKLSHLHFVSNEKAKKRLIQMGELESSIYVIGSPDIDIMLSDSLPTIDEVKKYYQIPFSDYAIFIYHPVTTELDLTENHINNVIDALKISKWNFIVIYPNNDMGAEIIHKAIKLLINQENFRIIPSLRFEYFITLLKHSKAIIGNSSASIREAPVYGVPTINIGTRQMNRFLHSSIINVPEDKDAIMNAMKNLPKSFPRSLNFGRGNSAEMFINCLYEDYLWMTKRQKQFCDLKSEESA